MSILSKLIGNLRAAAHGRASQLVNLGLEGERAPQLTDGTHPKGYALCAWVYVCVSRIAHAVAEGAVVVEKRQGTEWVEQPGHPLELLLDYVNSDDDQYLLLVETVSWLKLAGNAYWLLLKGTGTQPAALQVLPADRVKVVAGRGKRSGRVAGYTVTDEQGKKQTYSDEEVVHFKLFGGTDQLYGQSPLKPIEGEINTYMAGTAFNRDFLKGGGIPALIIKSAFEMTDDQLKRLRDRFDEWHATRGRGRKPLFLTGDLEAIITGQSIDQALVETLPRYMRETIAAAFGVPPSVAGIWDQAHYANAKEQKRDFYSGTVKQTWRLLESALNEQLAPLFGDGIRVRFNTTHIAAMQPDFVELAQAAVALTMSGVMRIDEVREHLFGLGPIGGDWGRARWGSFTTGIIADENGKAADAYSAPAPVEPVASAPAEGDQGTPAEEPASGAPEAAQGDEGSVPDGSAGKRMKGAVRRLSASQRASLLKAVDRGRRRFEREIKQAQAPWYDKLADEMVAKLKENADKGLFRPGRIKRPSAMQFAFDLEPAAEDLRETLMPILNETYKHAGQAAIAVIDAGLNFDMDNPKARAYLLSRKREMKTVTANAQTRARQSIEQGLAEGETIEDLTARVLQWAETGREGYAENVARTETGISFNQASLDGYAQGGATHKEWLAGGGPSPPARDWHTAMDGVVVPIDEDFELETGSFNGPGDPEMDAEDVCQCRCALAPAFGDNEGDSESD
ncbi:MAG: phage portal protein [Veillonellaceae bacterium]|nr:phage portal protein [Veillonellaceae bacterium]